MPTKLQKADFYHAVYELVRLIPRGRVSTYGHIADALGARGASRTVGYALTAHVKNGARGLPAHRVVNRHGLLTGKAHFPPPGMAALLEAEGVPIQNDQVQDFQALLWIPLRDLATED